VSAHDDPSPWWVTRGLAEIMLTAGYKLEELIGRGGMAVVFRAHDVRLNRTVGLKIVAPEHAADESYKQRFISESRAAAAVDHPHIVPIYEAGQARDVLFIAMRFVRGGDVSSLVRAQPLAASRAAEIVRQAASALDKAHAHGLVHRDIKPENMLLETDRDQDNDRADHVYLSDFGLSKGVLRASGPTPTGLFVGTLDYISPEQLEDKPLDGRADQYSLGCSAFKMLSSEPPFRRNSGPALIAAHLWAPPPLLTSLRPDLAGDVNLVLAKALAKSPQDRYRTCAEFARALTDALARPAGDPTQAPPARLRQPEPVDAPIQAGRPDAATPELAMPGQGWTPQPAPAAPQPAPAAPTPGSRSGTSRTRKIAIGSAAGLVVLAGIGLALAQVLASPPRSSNAAGSTHAARSRHHKGAQESLSSTGPTANPTSSSRSPGPTNTPAATSTGAPNTGDSAPAANGAPAGPKPATVLNPGTGNLGTNSVAFSATGVLATGGASGKTFLWNPADGNLITTVTDSGSRGVLGVAFSPTGATLATADQNHRCYVWNSANGSLIRTVTDPGSNGVLAVAFSPNGKLFATGDQNHHIYLWNSGSGDLVRTLTDPRSMGVDTLAFNPSGSMLAAGDYNGFTYLWKVATGGLTASLVAPSGASAVDAVAFSPDGNVVAAGAYDGTTYLWQVASLSLSATLTDPGSDTGVEAVAFSPDGRTLAAGDTDGSTYLWNLSDGALIKTFTIPGTGQRNVWAVAFSPDGGLLAAGDRVGGTDVWKVG
jgi:serine/threonine protein kinase